MAIVTVPPSISPRHPVSERRSSTVQHLREIAGAVNERSTEVFSSRWQDVVVQPTNPIAVDGPRAGMGSGTYVVVIPEIDLRLQVRAKVRLFISTMVLANLNNEGNNHDFRVVFEGEEIYLCRQRHTTGTRQKYDHFVDIGLLWTGANPDQSIPPGGYTVKFEARGTNDAEMDYRAVNGDTQTCVVVSSERT